jgi:predicted dehydrogenase
MMSRIRVAILGTSFGRLVQAVGFQRHPGFELVAIAGADTAKTGRLAAELGIPHGFGDWRKLLDQVACELVSVVTPVDLHHPMVMAALTSGRHVLCEKPAAMHRFQAAEMRDTAKRLGRVAGMNHEFRFLPARRTAVEMVRAGAIGVPRRVEILGRYPIWNRPESRGMTWLSDARRGGGILGALASHAAR